MATVLKRGLWEAAATYLEILLQQGEPVETAAPDLITALLNAHETVSPHTVTRVEALLAQLESAGHTALAVPLRKKLTAKLADGLGLEDLEEIAGEEDVQLRRHSHERRLTAVLSPEGSS